MNSRSKATFKDNYKHYFVTIEKSKKKDYVEANELHRVQRELKTRFPSLQVYKSTFELGSKYHQLHLHLLLRLSEYLLFKDNSNILGMRLFWRPIYNISGIDSYLRKDTRRYTQIAILTLNYFNHNYGFK